MKNETMLVVFDGGPPNIRWNEAVIVVFDGGPPNIRWNEALIVVFDDPPNIWWKMRQCL